jgi:hypothetical protein
MPGLYKHRGAKPMKPFGRLPRARLACDDTSDVSTRQIGFPHASFCSNRKSLLAFKTRIGYPKALTALLGQGFE